MKLLICLGNPEAQYNKTRHNIGFWVADAYAAEHQLTWHNKDRFKALVADAGGYLVVKPTTYYNLAGESTRALADFYKVEPNDILVVHDDLALPLGTLRTRVGGTHGGNNGIKSISQHMGEGTARLRIGTYNGAPLDQTAFVLSKFTAKEQRILTAQLPTITEVIASFLNDTFEPTTHA